LVGCRSPRTEGAASTTRIFTSMVRRSFDTTDSRTSPSPWRSRFQTSCRCPSGNVGRVTPVVMTALGSLLAAVPSAASSCRRTTPPSASLMPTPMCGGTLIASPATSAAPACG
jgi:hypothetical protein